MISTITIKAVLSVLFHLSGAPDDERERANPEVEITYKYSPVSPEFVIDATMICGPIDRAEVEFVSAKLINGGGLDPTQQQVDAWAQDWLDDEGYEKACEHGEKMRQPDPDSDR